MIAYELMLELSQYLPLPINFHCQSVRSIHYRLYVTTGVVLVITVDLVVQILQNPF